MKNMIGLKELRLKMGEFSSRVKQGETFIVLKQNKPLFKISPVEEADFIDPDPLADDNVEYFEDEQGMSITFKQGIRAGDLLDYLRKNV